MSWIRGSWLILFLHVAYGRDNITVTQASDVDYTPYLSHLTPMGNRTMARFDPKGMQALYFITNMFIEYVGSGLRKNIPAELIPAEDGNIGDVYNYVKEWLSFEKGIVICAGIGIGLAILIPVLGLIFWCCRCCGRCGANPAKTDKGSDSCQCGTLTLLFVLLCLVITFGVACGFMTNEYVKTAASKLNDTAQDSMDDIRGYLRDAQQHSTHVLVTNFKDLKDHVKDKLNDIQTESATMFDRGLKSVGAESILDIADSLVEADEDINTLNASFDRLRNLEKILLQNITDVQQNINLVAQGCRMKTGNANLCNQYSAAADNLTVVINYSDLFLSTGLREFETKMNTQVIEQIKKGRTKVRDLGKTLNEELQKGSETVINKLNEAHVQVLDLENRIRSEATKAQDYLNRMDLSPYHAYIFQYNDYLYYTKLGISVFVLSVLVFFILGALFGICGARSGTLYEDPFCNKGKGSCLLMCGVGWIFLLYLVVMLCITLLFIAGTNIQLLGCDTLANPSANNHLRVAAGLLHQYGLTSRHLRDIPGKLRKCHEDKSIYEVLDLNSTFEVEEKMQKRLADIDVMADVQVIVDDASRKVRDITFLTDAEKISLINLAQSPGVRDFRLDSINEKLQSETIIKGSVKAIMDNISPTMSSDPPTQSRLWDIRRELGFINDTISVMEEEKVKAFRVTQSLGKLLGDGNVAARILHFVNATDVTQKRLEETAEPMIRWIANETVDGLHKNIQDYMNFSIGQVRNEIGRCGPASLAINSTVRLICKDVLYPFNGFWLSVGWCLILFIPCLLIALALAWHYRVPESFRSSSSDSDFEPQTEIDTIPLAHRRKRVHPSSSSNATYDSRARQSKATQWAFHNAFKQPPGYYPVRKASQSFPSAPLSDENLYTRPPSYYYPGSTS
ncbi:prominin-1-A-like [Paramacrobiotus metropolitanus]|uniref:prominin-1-A-like n=1 Tax=Paramacrobiotus metropolitanus TaxID=2943436 RepID=UPI002445AA0F|nr:prominin-1-A-like [Paramacrobiotus metropolitanus]XP_055353716.1 prominin-1-A-like [Paramacrobiotus metropolitanus]XP_055353717.1 prominin-1-A-like [Paramacrobiotus metropolitanus]